MKTPIKSFRCPRWLLLPIHDLLHELRGIVPDDSRMLRILLVFGLKECHRMLRETGITDLILRSVEEEKKLQKRLPPPSTKLRSVSLPPRPAAEVAAVEPASALTPFPAPFAA